VRAAGARGREEQQRDGSPDSDRAGHVIVSTE
jgi:hypothetical protein